MHAANAWPCFQYHDDLLLNSYADLAISKSLLFSAPPVKDIFCWKQPSGFCIKMKGCPHSAIWPSSITWKINKIQLFYYTWYQTIPSQYNMNSFAILHNSKVVIPANYVDGNVIDWQYLEYRTTLGAHNNTSRYPCGESTTSIRSAYQARYGRTKILLTSVGIN